MNPEHHFQSGSWRMECDLADGARIRRLRFQEADLLTAKPEAFRPPQADYGRYETRPVFAYDDCFPTVEQCAHWPDLVKCAGCRGPERRLTATPPAHWLRCGFPDGWISRTTGSFGVLPWRIPAPSRSRFST